MQLIESRNIYDYKQILEGLADDMGYYYYATILSWCGIIDNDLDESMYWQLYLLKHKGNIIGMCGLYSQYPDRKDELWLSTFGIVPEKRSSGTGTKMLYLIIKEAKKIGCKKVMAYTASNGKALSFYHKNGFSYWGKVYDYLLKNKDLSRESFEDVNDHVIYKTL